MLTKTDYLRNTTLNAWLKGVPFTPPTNACMALFTTMPDTTGGGTEVNGGSYSRVAVNFTVPVNGFLYNNTPITFPTATADWGEVVAVGLFDSSSSGNLLYFGPLPDPIDVFSGEPVYFPSGNFSITEDESLWESGPGTTRVVVDTFANLQQAVTGEAEVIEILGLTSFHDGGEGVFNRRPKGSYTDDGRDVAVAGIWAYIRRKEYVDVAYTDGSINRVNQIWGGKLINGRTAIDPNAINPVWFGLSTTATKAINAAAIDTAIAFAATYSSGAHILFPPGSFATNKVHDVPSNVGIRGAGVDRTILRGWNGSDAMNAAGFRWLNPAFTLQGSRIVCSDMTIVSAANSSNVIEVLASNSSLYVMQPRISRVAIYMYGSGQVGIKLAATGSGSYIQKLLIEDCYCVGGTTTNGIVLQGCIGGRVQLGRFHNHNVPILLQDALSIVIDGTSLDSGQVALVKATGDSAGTVILNPNWEPQSGDTNFYHFDFNGCAGQATLDLGTASGYDPGHLIRPPTGGATFIGPDGAGGYANAIDTWGADSKVVGLSNKRLDGILRLRREPVTLSTANSLLDPLASNRRPLIDVTVTGSGSLAGFHTVAAHDYVDLEVILTAAGTLDVPIIHMSSAAAAGEKIVTPNGKTFYLRAATSGESPGWCKLRYNSTATLWYVVDQGNNILSPYEGEWQAYFDSNDLVTGVNSWYSRESDDTWSINGSTSLSRSATTSGKSLLIAGGAYLRCDAMGVRLWNGNTNDVAIHWHIKENSVAGIQEAFSVTNNASNSLIRYWTNTVTANLNVSQVNIPGSVTGVATADEHVLSATLIGTTLSLYKNGVSVGTYSTGTRSAATVVQTTFGVYGGDRTSNPANLYVRHIAVGLPTTFDPAALSSKWLNR